MCPHCLAADTKNLEPWSTLVELGHNFGSVQVGRCFASHDHHGMRFRHDGQVSQRLRYGNSIYPDFADLEGALIDTLYPCQLHPAP